MNWRGRKSIQAESKLAQIHTSTITPWLSRNILRPCLTTWPCLSHISLVRGTVIGAQEQWDLTIRKAQLWIKCISLEPRAWYFQISPTCNAEYKQTPCTWAADSRVLHPNWFLRPISSCLERELQRLISPVNICLIPSMACVVNTLPGLLNNSI